MAVQTRHDFPAPNLRQLTRLQIPDLRIMAAWARRPWRLDPVAALASILADGVSYVDGGVRSPTNADVLRREALDLVIIVSPMSGRALSRLHPASALRRYAAAKVNAEKAVLRAHGIPAVVIEPGAEAVDALGQDFMSHEHLTDIVTAAFFDTGEQLQQPFTRTLLAGLNRRHESRSLRTRPALVPPAA